MSENLSKNKRFRGANGRMRDFAPRFLTGRIEGFTKDMEICLTGMPSRTRDGETHAYFPALMSCCATLEYLSGLFAGRTEASKNDLIAYAGTFLPQPDYSPEIIRILEGVFRNPVAHRGISSGVWIDNHQDFKGRRLTWTVSEENKGPALQILEERSVLCVDSPWECPFTHRAHVYVGLLWQDIRDSVVGPGGYSEKLISDDRLLDNFERCMRELYPA